jgi:hypothetical protein
MTGRLLKGCGTKNDVVSSYPTRAAQKNAVPFDRDGKTLRRTYSCLLLALPAVMTARLGMVFFSVAGTAVGAMHGLLVIAGVMPGGMLAHVSLPGWRLRSGLFTGTT